MGWFWSSSSSSSSSPTSPQEQPRPLPPQPSDPVDAELQKFLHLFETDSQAPAQSQPPPPSAAQPSKATPPATSWPSPKTSPTANTADKTEAPLLDPLSESLLPTEMSCRQAFDLAWSCNGLGGQFTSVYRHGSMRSCSEQWHDFWFCMRARAHTGDLKASMIRAHYRDKAYRKYGEGKPSSEHVWESRSEKLPPGSAFSIAVEGAHSVPDADGRANEEERAMQQESRHDHDTE